MHVQHILPHKKKVNIANSIGRWCGNVSNAHILTCFQRKSLIKKVGEELLKSCETKWRYLAVTHTHPHPSKRQQTKTPTTHHPPPTACVCMCVLHNQLTFRWCLFLSLNPTLFQSQFAAKGFAGYHSHDTRVLNSFAIRTMCMANWQLQFSCQLSATKMDSTHWQYANDCMAQHYGTFARCRHIRVASSSTIPH